MAIVRDTGVNRHENKNGASGGTFANVAAGDDRILLVHLLFRDNSALPEVSSITRNGRSDFVEIVRQNETSQSSLLRSIWFYQLAPDTGNHEIQVALASTARWIITAYAYTGVDQSTPVAATATDSSAAGNAVALAFNPAVDGCALVGGVVHESANALTLTAGDELQNFDEGAYVTAAAHVIQTTAQAASVTWSASSTDNYAASGFVMRPVGAGGGGETHEGAAALAGVGSMAPAGQRLAQGVVALVSASALASSAQRVTGGAAALAAAGSLSAAGGRLLAATAMLAGAGGLSAAAERVLQGAAMLVGAGSVTAAGQRLLAGAASLASAAMATAVGSVTGMVEGVAALVGSGALSAAGQRMTSGAAALVGSAGMTAAGIVGAFVDAAAALLSSGSLSAAGQRVLQGRAALPVVASVAATGRGVRAGAAAMWGGALVTARAAMPVITGRVRMVFSGAGARRLEIAARQREGAAIAFSVKKPGDGFDVE